MSARRLAHLAVALLAPALAGACSILYSGYSSKFGDVLLGVEAGTIGNIATAPTAIYFSNDRLPSIRSFSCGSGLWIETCT